MASTTKSRDNSGHAGGAVRDGVINLNTLIERLRSVALASGGLVIHGSSSAVAKTASAFKYLAAPVGDTDGTPVWGSLAAGDTAAFAGTVTNALFNVFVHTVSDDGTGTQVKHTRMGTQGASRSAVLMPAIPAGEVVYGITEINPTGTGDFVGGTTALDDGTVAPGAVYTNIIGPFVGGSALQQVGIGSGAITS